MKRKSVNTEKTPTKRTKFYLINDDDDQEVLESGTKRKMDNMLQQYKEFIPKLAIMDEITYRHMKRQKLMSDQSTEYEIAKKEDMETERLKQLKEDFKDREKRSKILHDSYQKLLQSK